MDPVICIFPVTLASLPYLFIFVATLVLFISLLLSILIILLVFIILILLTMLIPLFYSSLIVLHASRGITKIRRIVTMKMV